MNKEDKDFYPPEELSYLYPVPRRIESKSAREKLFKLSVTEGTHRLFINSSIPLTPWIVLQETQPLPPFDVQISVEGPRVLWDDVKEVLTCHVIALVCSGFTSSFVYLGFYLYEKWKPLYVVTLNVKRILPKPRQANSDEKLIAKYEMRKKNTLEAEETTVIQNPMFKNSK